MEPISGPLNGLRVLDFSTLLPGPYATQILADLGAEVLRVEAPERPDMLRTAQPQLGEGGNMSAAHCSINRNKSCITLDLKLPESVAVIHELLESYDIVVEQFRPGVMARLGLDYSSLQKINPALIYCSITGYGQTGPLKHRAGHDINYLALSGLASYSGTRAEGPVLAGTQVADIAGGSHYAVMGLLAAVIERQATGKGQAIDISMSDASLALNAMSAAEHLAGCPAPEAESGLLNGGSFYDYYQTSDGRYLSVGSLEPVFLKGLLQAVEHPEWLALAAPQRWPELKDNLRKVFRSRDFHYWQQLFAELDVCVEPVLTLEEACAHPHFRKRDMLVKARLDSGEEYWQLANPIKFSNYDSPVIHRAGGEPGRDNKRVLALEDV